jgi:uncharacterized protein RhaS with RHS repeats
MTSQPETSTEVVYELALVELERHERANAPTLRDLRKAAQQSGLVAAFTDQAIGQQNQYQTETQPLDRKSVR